MSSSDDIDFMANSVIAKSKIIALMNSLPSDEEIHNNKINKEYDKKISLVRELIEVKNRVIKDLSSENRDPFELEEYLYDFEETFENLGWIKKYHEMFTMNENEELTIDNIPFEANDHVINSLEEERLGKLKTAKTVIVQNDENVQEEEDINPEPIAIAEHLLANDIGSVDRESNLDEIEADVPPSPKKTVRKRTVKKNLVFEDYENEQHCEWTPMSEEDKEFINTFNSMNNMQLAEAKLINRENIGKYISYNDDTESFGYSGGISEVDRIANIVFAKQPSLDPSIMEYHFPDSYEYMTKEDKKNEYLKQIEIATRRQNAGLPEQKFNLIRCPETWEKEITTTKDIEIQQEIIDESEKEKTSVNVFCYPVVYRYVSGELLTTINFVDKYVNVSRMLKYAFNMGYSSSQKDINVWFKTKLGKLLMTSGRNRFKNGVIHPRLGKIYKRDVRMGYRVATRLVYDSCTNLTNHKGVYLHPRIAHSVALWVSNEFALLFEKEYEDALDMYYAIDWIENPDEGRFDTPYLPTKKQVLVYRRTIGKGINYKPGEVNITVGDRSYINQVKKKPGINVLYHAKAVPVTELIISQLKVSVGFEKKYPNKYDFGSSENLIDAIDVIREYDRLPEEVADTWQDSIVKVENLGSFKEEKRIYDNEKRDEFQKSEYGIEPDILTVKNTLDNHWISASEYLQTINTSEGPKQFIWKFKPNPNREVWKK